MDWKQLQGHQRQRRWFENAIRQNRLGSTFLFVGPAGIGKRTFALLLAKTLFCQRSKPEEFAPCGHCPACVQVEASSHPDLIQISKGNESSLSIAQIAGERESRMQTGLCHDIHMSPQESGRRIAIIDDADTLTVEAANAMLKTLEEPPPGAILVLISTSPQRQLPTIRSRCQIVRFDPPEMEEAMTMLAARGLSTDPELLRQALELSGGDLLEAQRMLEPEAAEYREQIAASVSVAVPEAMRLVKLVSTYVDAGSAEAPVKRDRIRETMLVAISEYRRQIRGLIATGETIDQPLDRLERCLQTLQQVDRNVNTTTLIECWASDIQRARQFN